MYSGWNWDGFPEEQILEAENIEGNTTISTTFTVPCTATEGTTRLRTRTGLCPIGGTYPLYPDGCEHTYGETEEYELNVINCCNPAPLQVSIDVAETHDYPNYPAQYAGAGELHIIYDFTSTVNSSDVSYFWEFGDGATSNQANPSHEYNSPGVYYVTLIITDACGRELTEFQEIVYYCPANYTYYDPLGYYISGVTLEGETSDIVNVPTGDPSGPPYNDYTDDFIADLQAGNTYDITVNNSIETYTVGSNYVAAWIDWNHDGDFDDVGEKLGEFDFTNTTDDFAITFTVPSLCNDSTEMMVGPTRLRIRQANDTGGNVDPCINYSCGEIEDYTINLLATEIPITCEFEDGLCTGASMELIAQAPAGNWTYQWYKNGVPIPAPEGIKKTPLVFDAGVYTVVATNIFAGCTISNEVIVDGLPEFEAEIVCNHPGVCEEDLQYGVEIEIDPDYDVNWYQLASTPTGNTLKVNTSSDDFISTANPLTVYETGIYAAIVQNPDGCTDTLFQDVTYINPPIPFMMGDTLVCPSGSTTISTTPGYSYYHWTDENGSTITEGINANEITVTAGTYIVEV